MLGMPRTCPLSSVGQAGIRSRSARWQSGNLQDWPNLNSAFPQSGDFCGNADCLIEYLSFDQKISTKLLSRLGERAIGDESFSLARTRWGRHRLQRIYFARLSLAQRSYERCVESL